MKKQVISIFIALCLCVVLPPSISGKAINSKSMEDVKAWLDYEINVFAPNNIYGHGRGECVDFCNFYLSDLWGTSQIGGNAGTWRCPQGFEEINVKGNADNLQMGDLIVEDYSPYGHVAVYYGKENGRHWVVDQNSSYGTIKYPAKHIWYTPFENTTYCYRPPIGAGNRPKAPDKPTVKVYGAAVTVSWKDVANETSYNVYLVQSPWRWEDIKYSATVDQNITSYTFEGVQPGKYSAFVISMPNGAEVQSPWTEFSVVFPKKTNKPTATVDDDTVTLSWNNVSDEIGYNIYLVQDPWRWEDIKYKASVDKDITNYTFKNVVPGEYKGFVISMPNGTETQSPWVTITVPTKKENTKPTPTPKPTPKPTATPTPTPTPAPTATPTPTPTATPTPTPEPVKEPEPTPASVITPEPTEKTYPTVTSTPNETYKPNDSDVYIDDGSAIGDYGDDKTDEINPDDYNFEDFENEFRDEDEYDEIDSNEEEEDENRLKVGTVVKIKNGLIYKVTDIDEVAVTGINDDSLTTVTIPESVIIYDCEYEVVSIQKNAFKGNKKLKRVTILADLYEIGDNAFSGCKALERIDLSGEIEHIGRKAFYKCNKLKQILISTEELPEIDDKAFGKIYSKVAVKVPSGMASKFKKLLKKAGLPSKAVVK